MVYTLVLQASNQISPQSRSLLSNFKSPPVSCSVSDSLCSRFTSGPRVHRRGRVSQSLSWLNHCSPGRPAGLLCWQIIELKTEYGKLCVFSPSTHVHRHCDTQRTHMWPFRANRFDGVEWQIKGCLSKLWHIGSFPAGRKFHSINHHSPEQKSIQLRPQQPFNLSAAAHNTNRREDANEA